jgi:predicted PurR-regulated permease PerM
VKINALVPIVGIVAGSTVVGILGMFLAMPMLSILKVIFDNSEKYKPRRVLLGADGPKGSQLIL